MFDLFRSRDKAVRILLGGLLLLVALSMLTYLVPSYNTGADPNDVVVAEIGKETITLPDVQQVIQNNQRNNRVPSALMGSYIPQFINSMVTERALAYEARRLGFKISDTDVAAAIRTFIPQLFPDGKFAGKDAYAAVLAQQNMTIPEFESDVARQLLVSKLRNVAMEGIVVTPQEIEQEYKRRNEKVKIEYVKLDPNKLRASVQVTSDELRKYYEGNKALYQVPEKRNLGLLVIDEAKLQQNIHPTDAELLRLYNDNKDSYRSPERVNLRHILLKTTDMNAQQEAAVKAKAEDILKQLRAGANFADLAKKYSEDPGSASKGGEYDGVVRGQMVPEFEKAAFGLKPGQISDLVKTQYGFHIIQLISHEDARLKPFEEVKAQLAAEYQKQHANDLMQQMADKAQAALTKDPLHPETVAAGLGVEYVKADNFAAGTAVPSVGASRDFDDSVSALKKGEVSQPVVVANKIVMAVCTDVTPAHPAAFEEVQDKVREAVIKDKANRLMDEKANQLAEKARANGGNLQAAAKAMGLEVKTSTPVDRAGAVEGLGSASMISEAFTKPAGSIFGPASIPDAKVVGKVLEQTPADMNGLAAQRAGIRDEIRNRKSQDRGALFDEGIREALVREGKVKIHQEVVNRLLANYRG